MENNFLIASILFLLSLAIRTVYELLKEARRIDPENKQIFIAVFLTMCALWISWFSLCPADPGKYQLPDAVHLFGLAIFIMGTILAFGAFIQLRGVENIDHLVITGLFGKIRHPMYTGFLSWILGWSLFHGALISFLIGLPGIISILWWRYLEERRLERQFGSVYTDYRRTTWF